MSPKDERRDVRLHLTNHRGVEVELVLEPWGEIYPLAPDDKIVVIVRGPEPLDPEVSFTDGSVTVWAWVGSTMWVFKNGEELGAGPGQRPAVPDAFPKAKAPRA